MGWNHQLVQVSRNSSVICTKKIFNISLWSLSPKNPSQKMNPHFSCTMGSMGLLYLPTFTNQPNIGIFNIYLPNHPLVIYIYTSFFKSWPKLIPQMVSVTWLKPWRSVTKMGPNSQGHDLKNLVIHDASMWRLYIYLHENHISPLKTTIENNHSCRYINKMYVPESSVRVWNFSPKKTTKNRPLRGLKFHTQTEGTHGYSGSVPWIDPEHLGIGPHEQCSFHPGWLGYIRDGILPSYIGIIS